MERSSLRWVSARAPDHGPTRRARSHARVSSRPRRHRAHTRTMGRRIVYPPGTACRVECHSARAIATRGSDGGFDSQEKARLRPSTNLNMRGRRIAARVALSTSGTSCSSGDGSRPPRRRPPDRAVWPLCSPLQRRLPWRLRRCLRHLVRPEDGGQPHRRDRARDRSRCDRLSGVVPQKHTASSSPMRSSRQLARLATRCL